MEEEKKKKSKSNWILMPMKTEDIGLWMAYKYKAKFNYFIFIQGINVLGFIAFFLVIGIFLLLTYKPSILDPIEQIKSTYLYGMLIITGVVLIMTAGISLFANTKEKLVHYLSVTLIGSILILIMFVGIKINLDSTYQEEKFGELYETEVKEKSNKLYYRMEISMTSMGVKEETQKEIFIRENKRAYDYFKIKTTMVLILYALGILLIMYMLLKINQEVKAREQLEKDDNILYDKERNIKY